MIKNLNTYTKSLIYEDYFEDICGTAFWVDIVYVNEALQQVSGYTEDELLGENPMILSSGEHTKEEFQEMYETLMPAKTSQ